MMNTREQAEKALFVRHSEVKALEDEIQALEQQQAKVDVSDTQKAVAHLEELEHQVSSRRKVLNVVRAQLKQEQANLERIMRLEKAQLVETLRGREKQCVLDVLKALEGVQEGFQALEGVQAELHSAGGKGEYVVQLRNIQGVVEKELRTLKGFRPEWFSLSARPPKSEQRLYSAKANVRRLETLVAQLKKRQGSYVGNVSVDDIEKVQVQLEGAQHQLERLQEMA